MLQCLTNKSMSFKGPKSHKDEEKELVYSPGRAWKWVMNSTTRKLLYLLLLSSLFGVVGVAASHPPVLPRVQSSGRAEQGQAYSLTCVVEGLPGTDTTSSYVWYKEGDIIRSETKQVLTFTRLTPGDAGNYQCGLKRPPSLGILLSHPFQIREMVTVLPKPIITWEGEAVSGQCFTLECIILEHYTHNDRTFYTWYKNGIEIKRQSSKVLQFTKVRETDAGMYSCTAREGPVETTSPQSSAISLAPLVSPQVCIKTAYPDHAINGILGGNLTLTCEVTKAYPQVPDDGYSWSYLPSSRGKQRPLVGKVSTLTLGPLTREDGGRYFCQARNDQGFKGLNLTGNASVTIHIIYLQNITLTSDLEVVEGDLVNLTCKVDSYPAAHLAWIVHKQKIRIVTGNLDHYIIVSAECSDSTNYTCHASNTDLPGWELSASSTVLVHCKQEPSVTLSVHTCEHNSPPDNQFWAGFGAASALFLTILLLGLGFRFRQHILDFWKRHPYQLARSEELKTINTVLSFDTLNEKGKLHVFPHLVPPKEMHAAKATEGNDDETAKLLPSEHQVLTKEGAEFKVIDLIRTTLQQSTNENDLPMFLLHNTRLSRQENIVFILSRKLGVVLMLVKAVDEVKELPAEADAVGQLLQARKEVRERLGGLVKPGAVTAVLALPNLPWSNMKDVEQCLQNLGCDSDVELLLGQEKADFQQWTKKLTSRPDSDIWNPSSPGVDTPAVDVPAADSGVDRAAVNTTYKKAAAMFLTLTGCSPPGKSPRQPAAAEEGWLLTPAQLQVRDSTARLLHIWGPPGSGKTTFLIQKAIEWLAEGKAVVLAVGREFYDLRLAQMHTAVQKELDNKTLERIRVCRTYQEINRAVKELRGLQNETCVIIDVVRETDGFRRLLPQVKSKKLMYIWSTCRDNLQTLDTDLSREARQLGWESACLPDCIRCTESTVKLLNLLVQGSPDYTPIPACSLPRHGDIPAWRVVDHSLHPQHTSTTSCCPHCKEEMSKALPSPQDTSRDWRDWIALYTGNLDDFINFEPLHQALENVGVPNFYESKNYFRSDIMIPSTNSRTDTPDTGFADFREQILAGIDKEGKPTVHLISSADFRGMEKEGVILVHWDKRDNDPACQSQEERDTRLNQHRRQWFNTVSRSKGQVILLLLTPSPARTLLNLSEPALLQGVPGGEAASSPQGRQEAAEREPGQRPARRVREPGSQQAGHRATSTTSV